MFFGEAIKYNDKPSDKESENIKLISNMSLGLQHLVPCLGKSSLGRAYAYPIQAKAKATA